MDAVTCSSGAISETKMVVSIRLAFVENDGNAGRANLGWFMADDFSSLICDCRTTQRDTRGCLFGRPRISSFLFCFFLRTFFFDTHNSLRFLWLVKSRCRSGSVRETLFPVGRSSSCTRSANQQLRRYRCHFSWYLNGRTSCRLLLYIICFDWIQQFDF